MVKNPCANAGDARDVSSLGREEVATHCSILDWKIPWTEEAGGLQSMGSQRIRHDSAAKQQRKKMYNIRLCVCLFSSLRC